MPWNHEDKMVSITEQKIKKGFKKKNYRAWNLEGNDSGPNNTQPPLNMQDNELILKIDPKLIKNWKHHDRNEFELGDIDALSEDLLTNGQQQPIIIRTINNNDYKYEVIAGERRWRACINASIKVTAIVKTLSDAEAAACQISENANRKNISFYSMGMNYSELIKEKVVTRAELQKILKKPRSTIDELLSFAGVPNEVWSAIKDMSKVSSVTASRIRSLCNKDPNNIKKIIHIATAIREGAGARKIEALINKDSGKEQNNQNAVIVRSSDKRHIFTWKRDSNKNTSISFPMDIRKAINFKEIEETLKKAIETQLENLKKCTT